MLYLISGTSRSGKSLLARELHRDHGIPYLSTDWLMMGFNDGIPEYGIHHLLWPNEMAEKLWPFLKGMIDNMVFEGMDYVIEGEAMLPELIVQLVKQYPDQLRVIFVGYSTISVEDKVEQVKHFTKRDDDWLTSEPDDYIADHIKNMIGYSQKIQSECEKFSLNYIDTSTGFLDSLEGAKRYLLNSKG